MSRRDVVAIHHEQRVAVFDDDTFGEVTNWFDCLGQNNDEPIERPISCVVKHPSGKWYAVDLSHFDHIRTV
jgi:hypothetical protein